MDANGTRGRKVVEARLQTGEGLYGYALKQCDPVTMQFLFPKIY